MTYPITRIMGQEQSTNRLVCVNVTPSTIVYMIDVSYHSKSFQTFLIPVANVAIRKLTPRPFEVISSSNKFESIKITWAA